MIMAGNKMHELAISADTEIDQLLDSAEQEVMDIRKSSLTSTQWSLKKDIQTAMSNMEKMMDRRGDVLGLTTGYPVLDRMINGLKPGELFCSISWNIWRSKKRSPCSSFPAKCPACNSWNAFFTHAVE